MVWQIKSPTPRNSRCTRCGGRTAFQCDSAIWQLIQNVSDSQFDSINVRCLFTPCHTSGHMCYFVWEDECTDAPAVFTGLWAERRPGPLPLSLLRVVKPITSVCALLRSTGDTLFIGGCGRFLEGTAEQMYHNLTQVLGSLPQDTVSRNTATLWSVATKELTSTIMTSDTSRRESQRWGNSRTMKALIPVWLFSPFQCLKKTPQHTQSNPAAFSWF